MNNELNKWLAEKVMGWEPREMPSGGTTYFKSDKSFVMDFNWNPSENIQQANQCKKQFPQWESGFISGIKKYWCKIWHTDDFTEFTYAYSKESEEAAISLASAKAKGYEAAG